MPNLICSEIGLPWSRHRYMVSTSGFLSLAFRIRAQYEIKVLLTPSTKITLMSRSVCSFFGKGQSNLENNCFDLLSRIILKLGEILFWNFATKTLLFNTVVGASNKGLRSPNHICFSEGILGQVRIRCAAKKYVKITFSIYSV